MVSCELGVVREAPRERMPGLAQDGAARRCRADAAVPAATADPRPLLVADALLGFLALLALAALAGWLFLG